MKKYLVSIIIMVSAAVNAQSVSFGVGGVSEKTPMYGIANIGLPVVIGDIKVNPYCEYMTFPLQRLKTYQCPYVMDQWKAGVDFDFGFIYLKYSHQFSTRSIQQRNFDYGERYVKFQPYFEDANIVEFGFKHTFHTIKID